MARGHAKATSVWKENKIYIGRKVWFRQQGQLWQVLKRSLKSICCKNSGKTSEKEAKLKCR